MSLVPVPTEPASTTCAGCGAALVADQRYCLSCGQPASPVRLAFLDVLQSEQNRPHVRRGTIEIGPSGYMALAEQRGVNGWLRRYSGLLGLLTVLFMCLIVGLLVGHWTTQGKSPGTQVLKVEGLSAAPAAGTASTPPTSTTPAAGSTGGSSNGKAEAEEAKAEAKETKAEKAPPPAPVKVSSQTIKKLTKTRGTQHQQEINKLVEGGKPIETG